jgi:hypothetical protein
MQSVLTLIEKRKMPTMFDLAKKANLRVSRCWQGGSLFVYAVWNDEKNERVFVTRSHAVLMSWLRTVSA